MACTYHPQKPQRHLNATFHFTAGFQHLERNDLPVHSPTRTLNNTHHALRQHKPQSKPSLWGQQAAALRPPTAGKSLWGLCGKRAQGWHTMLESLAAFLPPVNALAHRPYKLALAGSLRRGLQGEMLPATFSPLPENRLKQKRPHSTLIHPYPNLLPLGLCPAPVSLLQASTLRPCHVPSPPKLALTPLDPISLQCL